METIIIPKEVLDAVELEPPKLTRKYYGGRKRGNNKIIYYNQVKVRGWRELAKAISEEGLYNLAEGSIKDLTNPKRGLSKVRSKLYPELIPQFVDEEDDNLLQLVNEHKLVVVTKEYGYRPANKRVK